MTAPVKVCRSGVCRALPAGVSSFTRIACGYKGELVKKKWRRSSDAAKVSWHGRKWQGEIT